MASTSGSVIASRLGVLRDGLAVQDRFLAGALQSGAAVLDDLLRRPIRWCQG